MKIQNIKTFKDLLGVYFDDKRMKPSPRRTNMFITQKDGSLVFKGELKPGISFPDNLAERNKTGNPEKALDLMFIQSARGRRNK
jgi:hypothetical protein